MKIIAAIYCAIKNKPYLCHILIEPAATDKRHNIMRTINQIEALVNANRLTEAEAIEYVVDNYGDESESTANVAVIEDYCEVESGYNQSVTYGDYTCSGEIIDWAWWHRNFYQHAVESKDSGELQCKIYHSQFYSFVNGKLVIVKLYETLNESDIR